MKNITEIRQKPQRREKIIQFGEGGFLRGFVDWMVQKLNDVENDFGSVVVVQPIETGRCDDLTAQNCLYTHVMRGAEGTEITLIDVISRCVKPYDNYGEFLDLAKNPDFEIIISNTTESGIEFLSTDKITDAPPKSFPAKLTALLHRRFDLSLPGFLILPCELIEHNGQKLKEVVLKYCDLWNLGDKFKAWIEDENTFCDTLVDRIVTGYQSSDDLNLGYVDNMANTSEYFHLWVINGDKKHSQKFPLEKAGLNVIWTTELEKYRTRKVRILNGAHTSVVPYAMLRSFETVKQCTDDKKMLSYIKKCVFDEIIPTLDLPEDELKSYAENVLVRFSNPHICHKLASIALNSVSKFKVRVLPSILEYRNRFNKNPETLIKAFAALIDFYKTDMTNDDPDVTEFMKTKTLGEILSNETLWGQNIDFLEHDIQEELQK